MSASVDSPGAGPVRASPVAAIARRRTHSQRLRLVAVLAILVAAHAYGWQVTQIEPIELVVGARNARHIFAGLVSPDLIERVEEQRTVEAPFGLGCEDPTPRAARVEVAGQLAILAVSPGCARAGQVVTASGSGLPAGRTAQLFLANRAGYVRPGPTFQIGDDGAYATAFLAPEDLGEFLIRVSASWPTNAWRASETLALTSRLMLETIFLALMGTTLSLMVAIPLSFLGAHNLTGGSPIGEAAYVLTRTLFNVLRSVEVMIIAVIMVVIVGIGPFAGVLAIVAHSIGALGKLYSEAIESIDPGPIEAITATGADRLQVVVFAVVPQVVPQFIAFTMYRWDINVRMSTIIGFVGGGGIGYILIQYINLLQWRQAATAIWLIAAVVIVMDFASARLRSRIV